MRNPFRPVKLALLLLTSVLAVFASGEFSNRRAPGFSLMDSHFQQHDLQDYHGKVLIIDFMQTGCPVCNTLADVLAEVSGKYGDKLAILSIVTLPDNFAEADKFVTRHRAVWPIVFDSGQVMMSYLKLQPNGNMNVHFPHLFFIDGNGAIRNDIASPEVNTVNAAALSAEIDKLLK